MRGQRILAAANDRRNLPLVTAARIRRRILRNGVNREKPEVFHRIIKRGETAKVKIEPPVSIPFPTKFPFRPLLDDCHIGSSSLSSTSLFPDRTSLLDLSHVLADYRVRTLNYGTSSQGCMNRGGSLIHFAHPV